MIVSLPSSSQYGMGRDPEYDTVEAGRYPGMSAFRIQNGRDVRGLRGMMRGIRRPKYDYVLVLIRLLCSVFGYRYLKYRVLVL